VAPEKQEAALSDLFSFLEQLGAEKPEDDEAAPAEPGLDARAEPEAEPASEPERAPATEAQHPEP
jgi:hypothetical protein